jgi:hypothetical protein
MSLETDHIIRRLSDEEIVHWRELFGEWPPVRITEEHMRQLKLKLRKVRERKTERGAERLHQRRGAA